MHVFYDSLAFILSQMQKKKTQKNSQGVEEVYVKNNKAKSDQSNLKVYSDSEEK